MFFKKNKECKEKNKRNYDMEYEFLAVPEIHTGKVKQEEEKEGHDTITYDTVAIPEIHVKK